MHRLWRAAVYLVTFAVPVVIAACYGTPYRYRKGGKVVDKATQAPISQIDVSCEHDGGFPMASASRFDGTFLLEYDVPCDAVTAVDELGPSDGGAPPDAGEDDAGVRTARYQTKTVPFDESASEILIELDRSN